jgi:hypothetical protein
MKDLEKHHRLRLQRFAKAAVRNEDIDALREDMMQSLQGLLTESRLDQAMKDAKQGKYDALDLDAELAVADAAVKAAKDAEEAAQKAAEAQMLKAAQEYASLADVTVPEVVEAQVDDAVKEAEKQASEEEKKTGFWMRIGGFFKGLFTSKDAEG